MEKSAYKAKQSLRSTRPCNLVNPDVARVFDDIAEECLKRGIRASAKYRQRHRPNACINNMAMHSLRRGEWAVVPTNKDGGYALMKKSALLQEKMKISATTRRRTDCRRWRKTWRWSMERCA